MLSAAWKSCEKTSFQLIRMLALAKPYDLTDIDLKMYKGIVSPTIHGNILKKMQADFRSSSTDCFLKRVS